jgi:ATP-dependent helicase HrpA
VDIVSYPALVDCDDSVAIRLFDYAGEAWLAHRRGVVRLALMGASQATRYLRKQLLRGNQYNLALAGASLDRAQLVDDLVSGACTRIVAPQQALPRTAEAFEAAVARVPGEIVTIATEMESTLLNALQPLADARRRLAAMPGGQYLDTRADIDAQLGALLAEGFVADTPAEWFAHYPRYMKALLVRVERLSGQYAKDQKHMAILEELVSPLQALLEQRPGVVLLTESVSRYRWMLEEFRVSLFAQNLGTRQAVSEKRLREQWQAVETWLADNPR